jgi:hypothetical protein
MKYFIFIRWEEEVGLHSLKDNEITLEELIVGSCQTFTQEGALDMEKGISLCTSYYW